MNLEITIPRLPAFVSTMRGAEAVVHDELGTAIDRLTLQGERFAKQVVPVRTRHLRRSITTQPATWAGSTVSGAWGTATTYAPYVEFGTRYMAAQPYMRPAMQRVNPLVSQEISAALRRIIGKLEAA